MICEKEYLCREIKIPTKMGKKIVMSVT